MIPDCDNVVKVSNPECGCVIVRGVFQEHFFQVAQKDVGIMNIVKFIDLIIYWYFKFAYVSNIQGWKCFETTDPNQSEIWLTEWRNVLIIYYNIEYVWKQENVMDVCSFL